MKTIRTLLEETLDQKEALRIATASGTLRRWREVVGPGLAERSWPDNYRSGTVWIAVTGSAWAQELRMMKPQILERLHALSGSKELFKDLRFGVRELNIPHELEPEPPMLIDDGVVRRSDRTIDEIFRKVSNKQSQ